MPKEEVNYYRDGDLEIRMALWDKDLSERHRMWGIRCAMYDIDHIVTEAPYRANSPKPHMESAWGIPKALVEYKHEDALMQNRSKYRLQWNCYAYLADGRDLPAICCFYRRKDYAMKVVPLNDFALEWFEEEMWVSEWRWVKFLHEVRGYKPIWSSIGPVHNTRPKNVQAA